MTGNEKVFDFISGLNYGIGKVKKMMQPTGHFIVKIYKDNFLQYGNPLYVWEAYKTCRKHEIKIPAWILNYFDKSAKNLLDICKDDDSTRASTQIQNALGFNWGTNKRNGFTYYQLVKEKIDIFLEVEEIKVEGFTQNAAFKQVAKRKGVSTSKVRNNYYEMKKSY